MPKYEFDFDKLTIADNDHFAILLPYGRPVWHIVDKVTVGGCLHLPAREGAALWAQFLAAYHAHMQQGADTTDETAREILDGIEGL